MRSRVERKDNFKEMNNLNAKYTALVSPSTDSSQCIVAEQAVKTGCIEGTEASPNVELPVQDTAKQDKSKNNHHSPQTVALAIMLYATVSLSIVFINRKLFSQTFKYPIFISWVQQILALVIYYVLAIVGMIFPRLKYFVLPQIKYRELRSVFLVSFLFVFSISFANMCLKFTQISTYQVARSLTLLFNVALSKIILKQSITLQTFVACLIVFVGFFINSLDNATIELAGIVTGVLASFFQALYNVCIKDVLPKLNNESNRLLFYNLLISAFLFVPPIFLLGEGDFYTKLVLDIYSPEFAKMWVPIVASGILGFTISFVTFFCVNCTSPVTFTVVGYAKACLQSLGGIVVLGETFNALSLSGIVLTLSGSTYYSYAKTKENQHKKEQVKDIEMKKQVVEADTKNAEE